MGIHHKLLSKFFSKMNIFVSNINFSTTEDSFQQLFAQFGDVESARIITDRETGRSRGFGFVEMNDEEGQKAIDALNGMDFEEMTLNVSVARPREERRPAHGGYNRGGYNNNRGGGYNRGGGFSRGGNRGGYDRRRSFDRDDRYSREDRYSRSNRYQDEERF